MKRMIPMFLAAISIAATLHGWDCASGVMTSSSHPPISDYAIIGDTRSAALISRDGSIDWLCWPRFDSRSMFARILDLDRGGCFAIRPSIPFKAGRRYIENTNVLETTFTTDNGVVRLTDLMPVMKEEEKKHRLTPFRQLLRRVEGVDGAVPMTMVFDPRPDYAQSTPNFKQRGDTITVEDGPSVLTLRTDIPLAGTTTPFDMMPLYILRLGTQVGIFKPRNQHS